MQREVMRLREQTNSFNSAVIVDANGWVKAISPDELMLKGVHLTTPVTRQALTERKPLVSQPSVSVANNLMVFVSYPIWSPDGTYQGFVGGTIYLKKKAFLTNCWANNSTVTALLFTWSTAATACCITKTAR